MFSYMTKELTHAIQAVKRGGSIAMKHLHKPFRIRTKTMHAHESKTEQGGASTWKEIVSDVDVEIETTIKKMLTTAFPHYSFKGEETEEFRGSSEYTWYLDPITSTTNYLHRTPHFATSLGLVHKGMPILGVVLDPYYNELFYAQKGTGAFLNNAPIDVSSAYSLQKALCVVDGNLYPFLQKNNLMSIRRLGSTALHITWIAAGRFDLFISSAVDLYAQLGAAAILTEAGGKITDLNGKEFSATSQSICASNRKLHAALLKHL